MRRFVLLLGFGGLVLSGCGGPTELSNDDIAKKKAELNAAAPASVKEANPQGDRGH